MFKCLHYSKIGESLKLHQKNSVLNQIKQVCFYIITVHVGYFVLFLYVVKLGILHAASLIVLMSKEK